MALVYADVNSDTSICAFLAAASIDPAGVLISSAVLTISSLMTSTSFASSFALESPLVIFCRMSLMTAAFASNQNEFVQRSSSFVADKNPSLRSNTDNGNYSFSFNKLMYFHAAMNYPSIKYPLPAAPSGSGSDVSLIVLWDNAPVLASKTITAIANLAIFGNRIEQNCRSAGRSLSLFIRAYALRVPARTSSSRVGTLCKT